MKHLSSNEELRELLSNLYTLTGIQTSIYDPEGRMVCQNTLERPFCRYLHETPEGERRCLKCNLREIDKAGKTGEIRFFRCHAGVCAAVVPIRLNEMPIAYLTFGQFLDKSSVERQWQKARQNLGGCGLDLERLERYFYELPTCSEKEIHAYAEVLRAVGSYIHMSSLMKQLGLSDLQRLDLYIEQHYAEKISLSSISEALEISRTKLCSLARELSGGLTLSQLIARRRVECAKRMLSGTDDSVSSIAEAVGIPDYNYFTKVFRTVAGVTPSEYRKQNRHID